MKSLYEKMNGSYVEVGDVKVGDVKVGDVKVPTLVSTDTNYAIDFWGQRHKAYLKEKHRMIYYNLVTSGKLNSYLHKIDIRAKEQYELLIKQLAKRQGITEQLKSKNQMLCVQRMNNITNQAREIIYNEILYNY